MGYEGPFPLPVKSGGTGDSTMTGVLTGNGTTAITANAITQYGTLIGGANNTLSSTAPSTVSYSLLSNGASSNPTFQAISGSSLVYLLSQTASSSSSLDYTSLITTAYKSYMIHYTYGASDSSLLSLTLLFSTDNGNNWIATNYLAGTLYNLYNSNTLSNINATTSVRYSATPTNTGNLRSSGNLFVMNCQTNAYCVVTGLGMGKNATTVLVNRACGTNTANTGVNAIRLSSSSGVLLSGTFTLYGIRES